MKWLSFVVACFALGVAISHRPQPIDVDAAIQAYVNEVLEISDEYEDAPGVPVYTGQTTVCTWGDDPADIECSQLPVQEYGDADTCEITEWERVAAAGYEATAQGLHLGGRVQCVAELEA